MINQEMERLLYPKILLSTKKIIYRILFNNKKNLILDLLTPFLFVKKNNCKETFSSPGVHTITTPPGVLRSQGRSIIGEQAHLNRWIVLRQPLATNQAVQHWRGNDPFHGLSKLIAQRRQQGLTSSWIWLLHVDVDILDLQLLFDILQKVVMHWRKEFRTVLVVVGLL